MFDVKDVLPLFPHDQVTIASLAAGGSFIPASWESSTVPATLYSGKAFRECPAQFGAYIPTSLTGLERQDILFGAVQRYMYGWVNNPTSSFDVASMAIANGIVTLTTGSAKSLTFAITEVRSAAGVLLAPSDGAYALAPAWLAHAFFRRHPPPHTPVSPSAARRST